MFDEKYNTYDYRKVDSGTLSKIINLSVLNPRIFTNPDWNIIIVNSPEYKQKLYSFSGGQQIILDSEAILLVVAKKTGSEDSYYMEASLEFDLPGNMAVQQKSEDNVSSLIFTSVLYSAKYFGLDSCLVSSMDFDQIKQAFKIDSNRKVLAAVCIGDLGAFPLPDSSIRRADYGNVVREV